MTRSACARSVPARAASAAGGCPTLRADLHVHSCHSGPSSSLPFFRSLDSYSPPEAVYRAARARGMDLVTITDHNSIDGCLELFARHADTSDLVMGEEIECRWPGTALRVHVGALGITEQLHREVQPLRANVFEAVPFLASAGVACVLHHLFHFYRGEVPLSAYLSGLLPLVHAVETRNGTMLAAHNRLIGRIVAPAAGTGGSDGHILAHVARTWTEVRASNREEFLAGVRGGGSRACGVDGGIFRLASEVYGVILNYWAALCGRGPHGLTPAERAVRIAVSVVSLPVQFVPGLVTVAQKTGEARRVRRWGREWAAIGTAARRDAANGAPSADPTWLTVESGRRAE